MGPNVSWLDNMVFPAPVTKIMHPPQAEWYQIVARHHREGAHGHLLGLFGDGSLKKSGVCQKVSKSDGRGGFGLFSKPKVMSFMDSPL